MIGQPAVSGRWRPSPIVFGPGPVWRFVLLVVGGFFLFVFASILLEFRAIGVAAVLLAVALAVAVWWQPYAAAVALVVGGSIHQFAMLLLLHFTHTVALVKVAQLWKEGVVLLLLALVLHQALLRRRPPVVNALDLCIVMFIVLGTFYLAFPNAVGTDSIVTKLFGLRLDAFALMAYFAGRGLVLKLRQVRLLLIVFAAVVLLIAAIAALEFVAPHAANGILDSLGQQQFAEQLGDPTQTESIRFNTLGSAVIPRASSLLLSDLGLAFYMLLGVPLIASLYLLTTRSAASQVLLNLLLLLAMGATVLTMTRSAWLAMGTIMVALTLASRRFRPALLLLAEIAVVGLVVVLAFRILPTLLSMMFSTKEGSLHAHLGALQTSLNILRDDPWGLGLGTAGPVSQKFLVAGGVTNESWYFQIGTELGVAGMLVWAALTAAFGVLAYKRYRQVHERWLQVLCLTMFGAIVGFAQVSFTLHAWSGLATSIIFWLLAGIVVQAPDIERRSAQQAIAEPHAPALVWAPSPAAST